MNDAKTVLLKKSYIFLFFKILKIFVAVSETSYDAYKKYFLMFT